MMTMIALARLVSSSTGAWRARADGAISPIAPKACRCAAGDTASPARSMAGEVARVARAAATLSPLERDVLALSAGRGLRVGEIALLLGISERRAERLLAKALGKFDRALARQCKARWHVS